MRQRDGREGDCGNLDALVLRTRLHVLIKRKVKRTRTLSTEHIQTYSGVLAMTNSDKYGLFMGKVLTVIAQVADGDPLGWRDGRS